MSARPGYCGQCGASMVPGGQFCGTCGHGRSVDETVPPSVSGTLDDANPTRTRRSPGLAWLMVAVAVLVVGGGVLATVLLTRDGGRASPESLAAPPAIEDEEVPLPDPETPTLTVPSSDSGASSGIGTSTTGCQPGGGNTRVSPVVDCVSARAESSGVVTVSASYCDRTPGSVNRFNYVFELLRSSGGGVLADATVARSQRRACNTVYATLSGPYEADDYVVRLVVQNLTNGVDGLGLSQAFRVR